MLEMVSSLEFQCFSEVEFGRCTWGRNSTRKIFLLGIAYQRHVKSADGAVEVHLSPLLFAPCRLPNCKVAAGI